MRSDKDLDDVRLDMVLLVHKLSGAFEGVCEDADLRAQWTWFGRQAVKLADEYKDAHRRHSLRLEDK